MGESACPVQRQLRAFFCSPAFLLFFSVSFSVKSDKSVAKVSDTASNSFTLFLMMPIFSSASMATHLTRSSATFLTPVASAPNKWHDLICSSAGSAPSFL